MSEISREEAMLNIRAIRDLWNNEYDYQSEYRDFLEDDPIETLNKAISDMKKLQKIEELFELKSFGEYPSNYEDIAKEVQKIVKGE